jgi:glycosyltransferase involved in cell wall biosynthesis
MSYLLYSLAYSTNLILKNPLMARYLNVCFISICVRKMGDNEVWIPCRPFHYSPSFYRVRSHINRVLTSLGVATRYYSGDKVPPRILRNSILVLSLNNNADLLRQSIVSYSNNRIYYGVTEGSIINPPPHGYRILVPSKYVADECERIELDYEAVIPHGFDPVQFDVDSINAKFLHYNLANDKVLFYFLSVYNQRRKGLNELFQAIRIVKKHVGSRFLVYIRTHQSPLCYPTAYEVKDVICVNQNYASDNEIALEMAASDCYLVPNLAEGFCMPAMEAAYGSGKPVIYPNTSPYNDYLTPEIGYPVSISSEKVVYQSRGRLFPHCYRFKYWDIQEFADQMIRVMYDREEASKKGRQAYYRRNNWTIYRTYKNLLRFIV